MSVYYPSLIFDEISFFVREMPEMSKHKRRVKDEFVLSPSANSVHVSYYYIDSQIAVLTAPPWCSGYRIRSHAEDPGFETHLGLFSKTFKNTN